MSDDRQVTPNLKPDPAPCVCGCGTVARPRAKAWQDGLSAHNRGCSCRRCVGSRQRGKAGRRERRIAKDTGGERSPLSGGLNGYDGRAGLDRWEETANEQVVRGFRRWINSKGVQTKIARLMALPGVRRHLILSWDGKPRWVVTPYEDAVELIREEAS